MIVKLSKLKFIFLANIIFSYLLFHKKKQNSTYYDQ